MQLRRRSIAIAVLALVAVGCLGIYVLIHALFRGDFDRGKYEIQQTQWSPQKMVAVVVKSSDKQALDGVEYFLLIGDHAFTVKEAKDAFYNKQAFFGTNQDCLSIQWLDASDLKVTCNGHSIGPDQIDVIKDNAKGVKITYENISSK